MWALWMGGWIRLIVTWDVFECNAIKNPASWLPRLIVTWDVFESPIGQRIIDCDTRLIVTWDVFEYSIFVVAFLVKLD